MHKASVWILGAAASLIAGPATAQGVNPLDTYRDAYGSPNYTSNLTPDPDDRKTLGPSISASDPFLTRTRPARGFGEVDEVGAGFWEYQADRLRQRRQEADEAEARRRLGSRPYGTGR